MKKLILIVAAFITVSVNAANEEPAISEKTLKTFHEVFAEASDVSWKAVNEQQSEASFKMNAIKMRVVIDNNGKLISTLRYYTEEHLPVQIRYALKKEFENKNTVGVTEYSKNDVTTYYVVLQDDKKMVNAVVDSDGNVTDAKTYTRGDL